MLFLWIFMLKRFWISILKYCTHVMRALSTALKSRKRVWEHFVELPALMCTVDFVRLEYFVFEFSASAVGRHFEQLEWDLIFFPLNPSEISPSGGHLCTLSPTCANVSSDRPERTAEPRVGFPHWKMRRILSRCVGAPLEPWCHMGRLERLHGRGVASCRGSHSGCWRWERDIVGKTWISRCDLHFNVFLVQKWFCLFTSVSAMFTLDESDTSERFFSLRIDASVLLFIHLEHFYIHLAKCVSFSYNCYKCQTNSCLTQWPEGPTLDTGLRDIFIKEFYIGIK